jgi:Asp-tRNA(Asn)/Glu-tRNA(Gln) amidotransferase A subunit family amidase
MEAEMAFSFEGEYLSGRDRLSVSLRQQIERGRGIAAVDYRRALAAVAGIHQVFEDMLQSCDAILTPAATGTAPHGLESTGSPVFCTPWTLCGMPAISLPLLRGENGLPLGVQLVGRRGDDARLLRTARWLWSHVAGAGAVVMPV